ncbi:hypothetical protein H2508_00785 [Parahaliea sp. F7430]|uniref:Lipoprotein n=1 Tax=Sediminihaliea albiluteola TaxID=2758564 RepID=A0A7W2TTP9_9GAMM|nr:hypothetical protein [Sediminihaliea albiluteola]MBA6411655.1 hypothetical protein [Sediminihaliea albiluteola]
MIPLAQLLRSLSVIVLAFGLSACVSQSHKTTAVPPLATASGEVSESLLLDVGIAIFDPGLSHHNGQAQVYPEVRKAEANYMPRLLAEVMQNSGAWGAVRVVPNAAQITDLRVAGKILHSDGEELKLHITATDSRNRQWLDRQYTGHASRYAYNSVTRTQYDPFQAVYHNIANDLLKVMEAQNSRDRERIRIVTELRFAQQFSADAFQGYLRQDSKGVYKVLRLPAHNDPMLERIQQIRERDHVFVDTMQEYYGNFSDKMYGPYQEWRKLGYQEAVALQELKRESMQRMIAGGLAVVAGIAAAGSNDRVSRTAGNVAIISGGYLFQSGLEKRNESQIHAEALEELGMSLEAEVAPQVVELENRSITLSGNVEDQYAQWRELLGDIYREEIGELALPDESANNGSVMRNN